MRTPNRDRCRSALAPCCAALVILVFIFPAAAITAGYEVFPNGTAYRATIDIVNTDRYEFSDVGVIGEQVPISVSNVTLTGNCSPCTFNWTTPILLSNTKEITFPKGNYTISYVAPLKDNHLTESFRSQYQVNVTLPEEFDVRNPLLAGISTGGSFIRHADNTTTLQWNKTTSFDLRFYDPGREELFFFFLQLMVIIIVVFVIIPYAMTMKKNQ
jgi:hypothetical protein